MIHLDVLILGLTLLLGACSTKESKKEVVEVKEETTLQPPYYIDLEKVISSEETVNLSTLSNNLTYIPLETTSKCLLKKVERFVYFNNTILVSDRGILCQYDNQGKFIRKVGQKGPGPKDYHSIFTIMKDDKRDKLNLLTLHKMLVYGKDMQCEESVRLDDYYYDGFATPWGTFLLYLGSKHRLEGDTTTIYSYAEVDPSGKVISKIPNPSPIVKKEKGLMFAIQPLYNYKGALRYMDYGNDTLFTLSPKRERIPYAICYLGSWKQRELSPFLTTPQEREEMKSQLLVDNICEDDKYLYIKLRWGLGEKYNYALFDKKTGEVKNIGKEGFKNDIDGGVSFFPQYIDEDGTRIMTVPAEEIVEKNSKKNASLSKVKEDDNPVFMIVK